MDVNVQPLIDNNNRAPRRENKLDVLRIECGVSDCPPRGPGCPPHGPGRPPRQTWWIWTSMGPGGPGQARGSRWIPFARPWFCDMPSRRAWFERSGSL